MVLRTELEHARENGVTFRSAWPPAMRVALRQATDEQRAWRLAFGTRGAWRAAYVGRAGASDALNRDTFLSD